MCTTSVFLADLQRRSPKFSFVLMPQTKTQMLSFLFTPKSPGWPPLGTNAYLDCQLQPSAERVQLHSILRKIGIKIDDTNLVVRIEFPVTTDSCRHFMSRSVTDSMVPPKGLSVA